MKKFILVVGLYCLQPNLHAAAINGPSEKNMAPRDASERAKTHFKNHYLDARNVNWYTISNDYMYCIFKKDETVNRVFYDQRGTWKYTMISYSGNLLTAGVRKQVNEDYEGYRITFVNELRTPNQQPVYVINIENEENIKVLRVQGDQIDAQQELEKSYNLK